MSRIGKKPIILPDKVSVTFQNGEVTVKGPKGELKNRFPYVDVTVSGNVVTVIPDTNAPGYKAYWGLARSIINNMVIGVSQGYRRELKIVGTGYRATKEGNKVILSVGYSSPVEIPPIEGIKISVPDQSTIVVEGIDKQRVGQVAANIRRIRPPEPYKGKGIRYSDEVVRRKEGKTK